MTAPRPTSRQRTKADRSAGRRAAAGRGMPNLAGPQRTARGRRIAPRSQRIDRSRPRPGTIAEYGNVRESGETAHASATPIVSARPKYSPAVFRTACHDGPHRPSADAGGATQEPKGGGRRRKGCVADGEALNRNRADAQGRDPYRTGDLSECSRHSRTFHTDGRRRRFRCAETSCSPSSWSGFCIREDRGTSHAVHSRPRLRHAVPERTGRRATSTPRAAAGRFARRTSDPDRKRISDCEPEIYAGADRLVCGTRNRTKRPIKKRDTATIRKTNNRHFGNTTIR